MEENIITEFHNNFEPRVKLKISDKTFQLGVYTDNDGKSIPKLDFYCKENSSEDNFYVGLVDSGLFGLSFII